MSNLHYALHIMEKTHKILVSKGLVGSSVVRELTKLGYNNLLLKKAVDIYLKNVGDLV